MEDDAALSAPSLVVRAGAGLLAVTGLTVGLVGLQSLLSVRFLGVAQYVPPAQLAVGVMAIVAAIFLGRARLWAAWGGLSLACLMAVGSLGWVIYTFGLGVFSLLALGSCFFGLLCLGVLPLTLGPCRRATAARERLREEGLDLGL